MKSSLFIIGLVSWTFFINDIYLIFIQSSNLKLLWSLDIVFFTFIPVVTIIYLYKKKYLSSEEIPFSVPIKLKHILLGFILCLTMYIVDYSFFGLLLRNSLPGGLFTGYPFPSDEPYRIITILYASISAGIIEEVIFRGIVITRLSKHIQSTFYLVIISCLFFALIHWGQGVGKVVDVFIFSIIPTLWFIKTRQLWGNIVYHTSYNLLIFSQY